VLRSISIKKEWCEKLPGQAEPGDQSRTRFPVVAARAEPLREAISSRSQKLKNVTGRHRAGGEAPAAAQVALTVRVATVRVSRVSTKGPPCARAFFESGERTHGGPCVAKGPEEHAVPSAAAATSATFGIGVVSRCRSAGGTRMAQPRDSCEKEWSAMI